MDPKSPVAIAANIKYFTGRKWLLPRLLSWLEQSSDRVFLLTGGPGTGKSMVMAWLAGAGPIPTDPTAQSQLEADTLVCCLPSTIARQPVAISHPKPLPKTSPISSPEGSPNLLKPDLLPSLNVCRSM